MSEITSKLRCCWSAGFSSQLDYGESILLLILIARFNVLCVYFTGAATWDTIATTKGLLRITVHYQCYGFGCYYTKLANKVSESDVKWTNWMKLLYLPNSEEQEPWMGLRRLVTVKKMWTGARMIDTQTATRKRTQYWRWKRNLKRKPTSTMYNKQKGRLKQINRHQTKWFILQKWICTILVSTRNYN